MSATAVAKICILCRCGQSNVYPQIKRSNKRFCTSQHTALDALPPKSQFQNQKLIIRFVVKKRRNRMLSQTKINLISTGCSELYSSPIVSPATPLQPNSSIGLQSAQVYVQPSLPFGVTDSPRQRGALPSALPDIPTLVTRISHL
jgi:hypothetical protein